MNFLKLMTSTFDIIMQVDIQISNNQALQMLSLFIV